MPEILLLIVAFFLFQLLIILHEYGHFLVAKRNQVEVEEFGLGFPPRLIGRRFGKGIWHSHYSLNLLPLGGFVRLKGENDGATGKGTYGNCSLYVKTKIILAGIAVNFLIAVVLFTILAWIGIPKLLPALPNFPDEQFSLAADTHIVEEKTLITYVFEDSPADTAGIQAGDSLVAFTTADEQRLPIISTDTLSEQTIALAGQAVVVEGLRDNQLQTWSVQLQTLAEAEASQTGRLGVQTADFIIQRNTWSAPITGVALGIQYTKVTLQGLWQAISALFVGDTEVAKESVTGPVGVFFILQASADQGIRLVLMVIALISLTLAIINLLPIPALDGGRLALTILFRKILKRPLTKKVEERIIGISMLGLLALMILVTVADVQRFLL